MAREITSKMGESPALRSNASEIGAFLDDAKALNPVRAGRLIFALDATMSRQPAWDQACRIQGEMFGVVGDAGSLAVQLVYYRGFSECRASKWVLRPQALRELMTRIDCRGGQTQIGKVLAHARRETVGTAVNALVFIGDAVEENPDELSHAAGQLGVLGLPCFMFQDGQDSRAEATFREIARLSRGAYFRFDQGSATALANLLRAVAAFAANGLPALAKQQSDESRLLLAQVGRGPAKGSR